MSNESKIKAAPKKSIADTIIDFVSPVPLDPAYYKYTPKEKIFMDIISNTATGGLVGGVIGKGLGAVGRKIGRYIDEMPQPRVDVIKKDPYGLAEGPSDRRVFIDKMLGNTTKRAKAKSNQLWETYQSSEPKYQPGRGHVGNVPAEVREKLFDDYAKFGNQFEKKYGDYSAVNMPEGFYLEYDTPLMTKLGRIAPEGRGLWERFRKISGLDKKMEELGIRPSKGYMGKE